MTHLKSISLILFCVLAVSWTASAQSTARQPYEGATHSYTWNGLAEGLEYEFYLTANREESNPLDDGSTFEFDFLETPNGTVGSEGRASVPIIWNNGAALNQYRLWFQAKIPGGCSNYRFVVITPQPNAFDVLSANIPVDNTESCPAVSAADGFNPVMGEAYSLGLTQLAFKVSREGGARNWSFKPELTSNPKNEELFVVSLVVTAGNQTETLTADANGLYTVPAVYSEVIVSVSVANIAGNDQVITLTATEQIEEGTQLRDNNPTNDAVQHTITVMPLIQGMEGV